MMTFREFLFKNPTGGRRTWLPPRKPKVPKVGPAGQPMIKQKNPSGAGFTHVPYANLGARDPWTYDNSDPAANAAAWTNSRAGMTLPARTYSDEENAAYDIFNSLP